MFIWGTNWIDLSNNNKKKKINLIHISFNTPTVYVDLFTDNKALNSMMNRISYNLIVDNMILYFLFLMSYTREISDWKKAHDILVWLIRLNELQLKSISCIPPGGYYDFIVKSQRRDIEYPQFRPQFTSQTVPLSYTSHHHHHTIILSFFHLILPTR